MYPYALTIIRKIIDNTIRASLWNNVLKLLVAIWLFFAGIHTYIYCIIALTFMDVATGIPASMKKGELFKSRILRKGLIEKIALYLIMLIAVFILELVVKSAFKYESFYMVLVVTMCVSTYELTSILENIAVLRPELPFISRLIKLSNKIQEKTLDIAEDKVDKVEIKK
ncbi:phage holin family protein [Chitinophaga sancti]|uniref:Phage holin family protein n=1 Tax=Chitinophaga sancti TaxID=1004 RepID=A0A1K1Q0D2_9BACT|nr:phage holin family protein [Chitinophaga sancti]WQD61458.1 phage holin family protein [Chitinophaga sancti]WQG92985.1 phage holin family protein [Chitinophaga sancti]SFW53147.1 Bacteriophage holin family protein [Chitinophaga sancti]